jgi:hypothetical protein
MSTGKKFFIGGCILLLAVCSLFIFRNALLDYFFNRFAGRIHDRTGMVLSAEDKGFEGIRNIYVQRLSLVPKGKDTLLYIARADVKISISKMLKLHAGFDEIFADSVRLNLVVYSDSSSNYQSLVQKKPAAGNTKKVKSRGFNDLASSVLSRIDDLFNENVILQSVQVNYRSDGLTDQLIIPELLFDRRNIRASMITASTDGVASYILSGKADARNTSYHFRIIRQSERASLPFIDRLDNLRISFDTLDLDLESDPDARAVPVKTSFSFKNLMVNHWRISPVDVLFSGFGAEFNWLIDDNRISVTDGSIFHLKSLPVSVAGFYERIPDRRLNMHVSFDAKAEDFFNSLPPGMFNTLKGFEATGSMQYRLMTDLFPDDPDKIQFSSSLKKENFRIKKFGAEYFPLINGDFQFTAMDGDRPVRTIYVGMGNPMYTSLAEISPYLQMSVLMAEDPSFMNHNGFVEEAFKESIIKNVKEKRFARGGSTISMQLVKNLFLSRNKSISRKLEEAMIVWIIEQNRLVSKERMLEIYMNIIEWGPDVYGAGEASRFYFSKLPNELNLSESIFLSSIIPHPKYFKYMFDSTGTLKERQKPYFTLIGNKLLSRNLITQPEFDQLSQPLKLSGQALQLIVPVDTLSADTLQLMMNGDN